jgi:hypothetical protein
MLKLVSQPRSTTSTTQENQSVMAHVFPFRAVTPTPETAVRVSSPPYDVMSTDEARTMALDNPLSFLRVIRSEIDLPVNTNPYSDEVYAKAAENYRTLKQTAPMEQSDTPRFYVYRLEMNGHVQTGIAATPAVADYDNNIIKKHEKTPTISSKRSRKFPISTSPTATIAPPVPVEPAQSFPRQPPTPPPTRHGHVSWPSSSLPVNCKSCPTTV